MLFEMNDKIIDTRMAPGVPFDQAYWVVPQKLMAGCYPGSENAQQAHRQLKGLLTHGIRHVINLMESDEFNWYDRMLVPYENLMASIAATLGVDVGFDRMPIKDWSVPSRLTMGKILDRIDACISQHKPVYVHCLGGLGRTGTVVGCYLARHGYAIDRNVLKLIQQLRQNSPIRHRTSPETPEQLDFVQSWVQGE
jgi:hypothetical protein